MITVLTRRVMMKKKLVLLLACLAIAMCLVIFNTMRGKEKLTDYNYGNKNDKWFYSTISVHPK